MVTASDISKYNIASFWDIVVSTDDLFSGSPNDPYLLADDNVSQMGIEYWDVTVAICPEGKCIA